MRPAPAVFGPEPLEPWQPNSAREHKRCRQLVVRAYAGGRLPHLIGDCRFALGQIGQELPAANFNLVPASRVDAETERGLRQDRAVFRRPQQRMNRLKQVALCR